MLCEKCQKNPATAKYQTINLMDGSTETTNLCGECYASFIPPNFQIPPGAAISPISPITIEGILPVVNSGTGTVGLPANFAETLIQGFLNAIQNIPSPQTGTGGFTSKPQAPNVPCPVCGLNFEEFKSGDGLRLGCAECYQAFAEPVEVYLKTLQSSTRHEGKIPKRSGVKLRQKRDVTRLRDALKKAVEAENFEEAAKLRDQIREMEVSL